MTLQDRGSSVNEKVGCAAAGLVFLVIVASCFPSKEDKGEPRAEPTPTVTVTATETVEVEATETVEVEVTVTATETVQETVSSGSGSTNREPAPPAPQPAPAAEYYENCAAARAAGATPIYEGQPGYGAATWTATATVWDASGANPQITPRAPRQSVPRDPCHAAALPQRFHCDSQERGCRITCSGGILCPAAGREPSDKDHRPRWPSPSRRKPRGSCPSCGKNRAA